MKTLYSSEDTSDVDFYITMIHRYYAIFDVTINKDYQFVYDEFLKHLILDTENIVEKYPNKKITYKMNVFKNIFQQHINSNAWRDKLKHPEKFPEFKRKIRTNKLNKIQNDTIYNISIT